MAEKLVHTGYGNGQSNFPIRLYVTYETSQDTATNTSTITCGMYVTTPGSSWTIGTWTDYGPSYVGTTSLTFNGTIPNFGGSRTLVSGKQFTVQHNEDGTGKATIAWAWGVNSSWGGFVKPSGSFSIDLPTIPRYFSQTPSLTCDSTTETTANFTWSTSETCTQVTCYYRRSGTDTWYNTNAYTSSSGNGKTSGTFSISGLVANSTYRVYIKCTRRDSKLQSDSATISPATHQYPYITSTPDFTLRDKLRISFHNPLGRSCSVYIQNPLGEEIGGDTTTGSFIEGYTGSAFTDLLYRGIPNSSEGRYKVRFVCNEVSINTTVNGGIYRIRGDEVPTFSSNNVINVVDTLLVDTITGNGSKIIKGHNKITGNITKMTPNYGANGGRYVITANASPTSQELSYDNGATKSFTFENLTTSSFSITAYDARGLSTPKTKNITLIEYATPKVNEFIVNRQNGLGEYAIITANGTFTHWNGWSEIKQYNSVQAIYFRYRPVGASSWTLGWTNISDGLTKNSDGSWSLNKTLDIVFDVTVKYEFQMYMTDLLESSARASNTLSTANGFLWRDLLNKWLGINKKPERTLDVNGEIGCSNIYINGVSLLDKTYPVGSIYLSMNSTDPGTLFGGTWQRIAGGKMLLGATTGAETDLGNFGYGKSSNGYWYALDNAGERININTIGTTWGETKHTLTAEEMPRHLHGGVRRNNDGEFSGGGASTGTSTGSASTQYWTDYAGGGLSHNNMPPFLVICVWQRTA